MTDQKELTDYEKSLLYKCGWTLTRDGNVETIVYKDGSICTGIGIRIVLEFLMDGEEETKV